jgi:hypothetical protein
MWKFLIIFIVAPLQLFSQSIIPVAATDFPDAIVQRPDTFDISTVLTYNNDADFFLEFGFNSLMVQEILWENTKVRVEVYRMNTPEGAFGAYSMSVVTCLRRDTLCGSDCNTVFQYQCAYGNLYISVTSESGSDAARARYLPVAKAVMKRNPRQPLQLPEPFDSPKMKNLKQNLVYVQGSMALQNSLYPVQDLFLGVRFGMYVILLQVPDAEVYFARIRFETPQDMVRFLRLGGLMQGDTPVPNIMNDDGIYREYRQLDEVTVYFLQGQVPWSIENVLQQVK